MGLTYAKLKLTNLFNRQSVEIEALVHAGATFMCVTEEVAHQLGFDTTEVARQFVRTADGRQINVPKIAPIEIAFENRSYVTEAVVLGDECLMGVLPMEAMDLVVESITERLKVNPAHPNYPVASAK
jgi:clan AA aspartic protease